MGAGSLTDEERIGEDLFKWKVKRGSNNLRVVEIDAWLSTVGRKAHKNKHDQSVKQDLLAEKSELMQESLMLKAKIQKAVKDLAEVRARKKLAGVVGGGGEKVSDHALVRWLERKHGLNVGAMKADLHEEMLRAKAEGTVEVRSRGLKVTSGGLVYIVGQADGSVITCYYDNQDDED